MAKIYQTALKGLFLTLSLLLLHNFNGFAQQRVHVSTTGSDVTGTGSASAPFATVQTAVNQASANDTVFIFGGFFNEFNIDIPEGKSLVIWGDTTAGASVVIDAQFFGRIFSYFHPNDDGVPANVNLFFHNLTLQDGFHSFFPVQGGISAHGGAMYLKSDDPLSSLDVTIHNCRFYNNRVSMPFDLVNSAYGGAVSYDGGGNALSSIRIIRSIFAENQVFQLSNGGLGGAVSIQNASASLCHLTFYDNEAVGGVQLTLADILNERVGGGAFFFDSPLNVSAVAALTNLVFSNNRAYDTRGLQPVEGGAIFKPNTANGRLDVQNALFFQNFSTAPANTVYPDPARTDINISLGTFVENLDPLFLDEANRDFRLRFCPQQSPAIDAGVPGVFSCEPNSNVTAPDLGAIEVGTDPINITANAENVQCNGFDNGAIDLTVTGGYGEYTFSWSDGPTSEDRIDLRPAGYTVTVCDANGCCETANFNITEPNAMQFDIINQTNLDCFNGLDGEIDIEVSGGTPFTDPTREPYDYIWTTGATTQDVIDLPAAEHCVTVTDALGCQLNRCITLTQPDDPLRVDVTNQTNVSCNGGNDGAITLSASGGTSAGGYTFNWSNGAGNTPSISNLTEGQYCVTVTDDNGCLLAPCVTITEPDPIVIGVEDFQNVACNGDSTAQILLEVTGGTNPYNYEWTTNVPFAQRFNEDVIGIDAGIFTVTVTDDNGCPPVTRTFNVTEPANPLTITLDLFQDVLCHGDSSGIVDLRVTGGTGNYTFVWTNGIVDTFATTEDLINVPVGNYLLNVTDDNGCTADFAAPVTQPDPLDASLNAVSDVTCAGREDGGARFDVTGGVPNYRYFWSNGSREEEVTNLDAGQACLTITDQNNCSITECIVIGEPDTLGVQVDRVQGVSCFGLTDGEVDITPIGGNPGAFSFIWSNASVEEDPRDLPPGEACVEVRDALGCVAQTCVTIIEPDTLVIDSVLQQNVTCNGVGNGYIEIAISGGTVFDPPIFNDPNEIDATPVSYRYRWFRDGSPYSAEGNLDTLQNLTPAEYCLETEDANGCLATRCFDISEPELLTRLMVDSVDVLCAGGINGEATVVADGGAEPYTFEWVRLNDNTVVFTETSDSISTATGLSAGNYQVRIVDATGNCETFASVIINEPFTLDLIFVGRENVSCQGGSDGRLEVRALSGTPPYSFLWNTGNPNDTLAVLDSVPAGTYSVTVTDANGCQADLRDLSVGEPESSPIILLVRLNNVRCFGESSGSVQVRTVGGTAPYDYLWDTGAAGDLLTNVGAGLYCVTTTDANGCEASRCETIVEPDSLEGSIAATFDETCDRVMDGAILLDVIGGTQPYRYNWSNGATTRNLNGVEGGAYCVTVTDANGCSTPPVCADIVAPDSLIITLDSINPVTCAGGANGGIFISVTGGTEPYDFIWTPGNAGSEDLVNFAAGTYTVLVRDANGCTAAASYDLEEIQALTIDNVVVTPVRCNGESNGAISLDVNGGTPPYQYDWPHDPALNSQDINGLPAACYSLLVTDANDCIATINPCVPEPDPLVATINSIQDVSCRNDSDAVVDIDVTGGNPPYSYLWNTTDTTQDLSGIPGGTYSVVVSDTNNCSFFLAPIEVEEPNQLRIEETAKNNPTCFGLADGEVVLNALGGVPPYRYLWNNGETDEEINDLPDGEFCLTVTDANNCTADTCVIMVEPDSLDVLVDFVNNATCTGADNGSIELTTIGGTPPYRHVWSRADGAGFSETTEDVANLAPGRYCVEIIDDNGCSNTFCFDITREPEPDVDFTGLDTVYCTNGEITRLEAIPAGGFFTGPGVVNAQNDFDPSTLTPGVYELEYAGVLNNCPYDTTILFEVFNAPAKLQVTIQGRPVAAPQFCTDNDVGYQLFYFPFDPLYFATFSGEGVEQNGTSFVFRPSSVSGPGTYTVTGVITDSRTGCDTTITLDFQVDEPLNFSVVAVDETICAGEATQMIANGADTYTWISDEGLDCSPNCIDTNNVRVAAPRRTITYTVTGERGGCSAEATQTIEVIPTPPFTIRASQSEICAGLSTTLSIQTEGDYDFNWAPALNLSAATGSSVAASPEVTSTYTVTGLLPDGCTRTDSITILVNPSQALAEAVDPVICFGDTTTLNASSTQPGVFQFIWLPAVRTSSITGPSIQASPLSTTTYTVIRSGTGNCRRTEVTIEVIQESTEITGLDDAYCITEGCVTLNATEPGGTFSGPGVNGTDFCPQDAGAGLHPITYETTVNGCPVSSETEVEVVIDAPAEITNLQDEYCAFSPEQSLTVSPLGSVVTDNRNSVVNNVFDPSAVNATTVTFTVTPPDGVCASVGNYTIDVFDDAVDLLIGDKYCSDQAGVPLAGVPAGGTFTINGQIATEFDPAALGVGVHIVEYRGNYGPCKYAIQKPVEVGPPLSLTANVINASDSLINNGIMFLFASGGTAPYEYSIDGGPYQAAPVFVGLFPKIYDVSVRSANGCETTVQIEVGSQTVYCNPPQNLTAFDIATRSASLSWDAIAGAEGYRVSYRSLASATSPWISFNTDTNFAELSGLSPNTSYRVVVQTICENGNLSTDALLPLLSTNITANICEHPVLLTPIIDQTRIVLRWQSVLSADSYDLRWRPFGSASWTYVNLPGAAANIYPLENLTPNTLYEYELRVRCDLGVSDWSGVSTARTLPDISCATPEITAVLPQVRQAEIQWGAVSGAFNYVLSWKLTDSPFDPWVNINVVGTSFVMRNLTPNTRYSVRVRARCADGLSPWSAIKTFQTGTPKISAAQDINSAALSVYPNPNNGVFSIAYESDASQKIKLRLLNPAGKTVFVTSLIAGQGKNEYLIGSEKNVPPGAYILQVDAEAGTYFTRVLVN